MTRDDLRVRNTAVTLDQWFWRVTLPGAPEGDYGPLNAIAPHRVDLNRVRRLRADRQDLAPAGPGRPGRPRLPAHVNTQLTAQESRHRLAARSSTGSAASCARPTEKAK